MTYAVTLDGERVYSGELDGALTYAGEIPVADWDSRDWDIVALDSEGRPVDLTPENEELAG